MACAATLDISAERDAVIQGISGVLSLSSCRFIFSLLWGERDVRVSKPKIRMRALAKYGLLSTSAAELAPRPAPAPAAASAARRGPSGSGGPRPPVGATA